MNAEERTLRAIKLTWDVLRLAISDPVVLVLMDANGVTPEHIEDTIIEILEYREKTKEEEKPSG